MSKKSSPNTTGSNLLPTDPNLFNEINRHSNNITASIFHTTSMKYRRPSLVTALPGSTQLNPYFSLYEDTNVCKYQHADVPYVEYLQEYDHRLEKKVCLVNDSGMYLTLLDNNGKMMLIPPRYDINHPHTQEPAVWIIEKENYGTASDTAMNQASLYEKVTDSPVMSRNTAKFPKAVHHVTIPNLKHFGPLYLPAINSVVGISVTTDRITTDEMELYKSKHPLFVSPQNLASSYIEELKLELTKTNAFAIVVNDPRRQYASYYVSINNEIVSVPIVHNDLDDAYMTIITRRHDPHTGEEDQLIVYRCTDYNTVFQEANKLLITNTAEDIHVKTAWICGVSYKEVRALLKKHLTDTGVIAYTTTEIESIVAERTKLLVEKNKLQEIEISKLNSDIRITQLEVDRLQRAIDEAVMSKKQEIDLKVAETKLKREEVTTHSKEVSATGDMAKVIIGGAATLGAALLYYVAKSSSGIRGATSAITSSIGVSSTSTSVCTTIGSTFSSVVSGIGGVFSSVVSGIGGVFSSVSSYLPFLCFL